MYNMSDDIKGCGERTGEKNRSCQEELLFYNMVKKGLNIKVTFEQKLKRNEEVSYEDFQEECFKQRK